MPKCIRLANAYILHRFLYKIAFIVLWHFITLFFSLSHLYLFLYCSWLKTTKTCIVRPSIVPLLYCVTVTLYLRDIRIYLWSNICATKTLQNCYCCCCQTNNPTISSEQKKQKKIAWEYKKKKSSTYLLLTLSQLVYAMFFGMVVDIRVYIRIRMVMLRTFYYCCIKAMQMCPKK